MFLFKALDALINHEIFRHTVFVPHTSLNDLIIILNVSTMLLLHIDNIVFFVYLKGGMRSQIMEPVM